MFKGSGTALVTPFKNGKVDEKALRNLIDFQIENGTDFVVPVGTTGESSTLSHDEHIEVIRSVHYRQYDKRQRDFFYGE